MHKYPFIEFIGRSQSEPENNQLSKLLQNLPNISPVGPWVAGGAVRRTLLDTPLDSDVDFFFSDEAQRKGFEEHLKDKGFEEISKTDHATNFSGDVEGKEIIVQSVHMAYYENPEAVIDSFDFTITQFAFDGTHLYCGEFSLWDLARKKLALHKLTYGVSTVRRLIKYTKQGFTACGGCLADILEATISDPTTVNRQVQYVD